MSKFSKKVVSAALTATTAVWASGAMLVFPVAAHAQSAVDLQAQIAALLAQIQQLQAQLAQQGGGAPASSFTRDLTVGSRGADVSSLQQILISGGYLTAVSAPTGYFGSATKAALAKWQAAKGISPAAGYFGPISRAAIGGGGPVAVPGLPGTFALASDSPSGSIVAGAGQVDVMKFRITGPASISELKFNKVGVVSDTLINNLYIADEGGTVIAQYSSLSGGVATFSGLNWNIGAGSSRTYTLRVDISSSATAGNTIAWALGSITSNTMTVTTVTNPSIATASFDHQAVGTSVDAGTQSVLVSNATVSVNNSAVYLRSIKYTVVGSVDMNNVRNVKLSVNGNQVGSTVGQASADGSVVFALGTAVKLPTGSNTVQVNADVMGSPNRNMTWNILRPYDVYVVDSQYNTGISPSFVDTNSGQVSINSGQITVQVASDTPTGNIPVGVSNVTLAKFAIYAAGEPVKVKFLPVKLTASMTTATSTVATDLRNLSIVDDAGGQVGNTISSPSATNCDDNEWDGLSGDTVICDFGTSSSPVNYIVPANTTRVLSVKVDIQSGSDLSALKADLSTQTAGLVTVANNLEGQISFQTATSGGASGSQLTVVSNPLSVTVNSAYTAPTLVASAVDAKIGSYVFTAASAEGAKVTTVTITIPVGTDAGADDIAGKIQNLKVKVGGAQFGSTRATVNAASNDDVSVQFSGGTITVPAGGSVTLDVYADILSGATDGGTAWTTLSGVTATGATSNSTLTVGGVTATGQNVALASTRTLTVAQDSATAAQKFVVMNTTGNSLFKIRFTADNVEDIKITDLRFDDDIASGATGQASFSNITVWDGSTQVGGPLPLTVVGSTTGTVTFSFATPIVVQKNQSKTIELRGDVATFEAGALSNSQHRFKVSPTSSVTALGVSSNGSALVSGTALANTHTVARSKLTITSAVSGVGSGRTRSGVDDVALMTFAANSGYQVTVNTVTLKFQGLAVSNGTSITATLIDADTNAVWGSSAAVSTTSGAGNSISISFSPVYIVSAGASKNVKVRLNSSSFFNGSQTSDSLTVTVDAAGDVGWSDGSNNFSLETTVTPLVVAAVSYE